MTTSTSTRFSRNLSLIAFAPLALALLVIAMGQAMAAPAEVEENRIILRAIDHHPANARAAKRIWAKIDGAALEVCGGGGQSNAQVNYAVRRSDCWHNAMNGGLGQISTPFLPVALGKGLPARP